MSKRILTGLLLALAVTLLIAGCGKADKFPPADIDPAVDVCEVCHMAVADDQHATQLILNNGRALKFDDIGDLFVWRERNGLDDVNVQYVRDFHTKEWIELDEAYYAYDPSFKTPMGYGVLSFSKKADAERYIADQGVGVLLTASDLTSHSWESSMDHHGHDHGDHGHGDHDDHGHDD